MNSMTRFGLLTILGDLPGKRKYFLCRCDCGTEKPIRADHLRSGRTISCGCEHSRRSRARAHNVHKANTTHGMSGSRAYKIWANMKSRCTNPKNAYFQYYGGRGIKVCDAWSHSFEAFIADMGEPAEGQEIDRIDNDGNYEPGNTRWASRSQQQNNRRVNRLITFDGETRTVNEWSRLTGIHRNTLDQRLKTGAPLEEVFNANLRKNTSGLSLGGKANGARLRAMTHCARGHLFDDANTISKKDGGRLCRTCRNARARSYNHS